MTDILNFKNRSNVPYRFSLSEILIIRYAAAYILLFTAGLIGYYIVEVPLSEKLNSYVNSYFSYTFNSSIKLTDNFSALFLVSFSDIKTLALIFVGGFTMFSSIAIYSLLGYHALSLGFSSLYLVNAMSAGVLDDISFFDLILFLLSNAAVSSILIIFSSKTRIFNDSFKRLGGRKKLIIRFKPLYVHIFTGISLCGAVIFINIIRFIFNIL